MSTPVRLRYAASLAAMLVLGAACLFGQDAPPSEDTHTISMDVQRVVLYVTVREGKTGYVGDLSKEHFTVKDDGRVQEIHEFQRADVPVAVGIVIDNSQSMMNKRGEVVEAAKAFVRASNPDDEMFVIHFSETIKFGLPPDKMFSSDRQELEKALDKMSLEGHTALYDAIHVAVEHLKKSQMTKKALFVVSDGGDNRSGRKLKDVVKEADLSGALFYAIGIYDPMDGDANPGVIRRLAKATGGEAFFPKSLPEIASLCESIARDLRNQYMIVYAPPKRPKDGAYHKVQVTVKDPRDRKLNVTSRSGYYSPAAAVPPQEKAQ
jgi:VWFA-related protein